MENESVHFKVGQTFDSFEALEAVIQELERTSFVRLWRRSSRSLGAARKRATEKAFNGNLKYAEIDFACVHGGGPHRSRSKGFRPNRSTFRQECPFSVKIRTTEDGQKLFVKTLNDEHNHDISKTAADPFTDLGTANADAAGDGMKKMPPRKVDRKMLLQHGINVSKNQCTRHNKKVLFQRVYQDSEVISHLQNKEQKPSSQDYFSVASAVTKKIASIVAQLPRAQFLAAMSTLESLASAWEAGKYVSLESDSDEETALEENDPVRDSHVESVSDTDTDSDSLAGLPISFPSRIQPPAPPTEPVLSSISIQLSQKIETEQVVAGPSAAVTSASSKPAAISSTIVPPPAAPNNPTASGPTTADVASTVPENTDPATTVSVTSVSCKLAKRDRAGGLDPAASDLSIKRYKVTTEGLKPLKTTLEVKGPP